MAYMNGRSSGEPRIVVCAHGFTFGAIETSYPGIPGRTCGDLDLRVSKKMRTLGSTLLREFTHAGLLVMPPLAYDVEGVQDHVYGAHSC
jgi:hypothetical protein